MQTRPYPEDGGRRIWLARDERARLLNVVEEDPRRRIAFMLGLHGLRTDEVVDVQPQHVRQLANSDTYVLVVEDGKTGKRETPISEDLAQSIRYLKNAAQLRMDDDVIDVSKRSVRNWTEDAREELAAVDDDERWHSFGMHDLRRTWATDSFYSLALGGVPIAETLVLSWGGWAQTRTGRETFHTNYLGPVPDHITKRAAEHLELET